jgi:hypothetical protein
VLFHVTRFVGFYFLVLHARGRPALGLNHDVARFDLAYVRDQVYLRPHPKELMLRNHVCAGCPSALDGS